MTPDIVLAILLPGLVFEAAVRTPFEQLRPSLIGVLLLAVPGVLILAVSVGAVLAATTPLPFGSAFLVGAMVAATDPAAVIATFARIRAPRRLATIVEAESVLNDGTGIVIFAIALGALVDGSSAGGGLLAFAVTITGSLAIGVIAGVVITRVIAVVDDHLVELAATVVLAYGSYLLAEQLHWSGIIATVLAGATLGSYGRTHGLSGRALEAIDTVWEFVAFLLTALIFLLLGLAISLDAVAAALVPIGWAIVAVLVGRAIVVYLLVGGVARLGSRLRPEQIAPLPLPWLHVLFWAGLRGAVSVALALSLPADLEHRELLQGITFGIVLFTLLVQGSTAELLVNRLFPTQDPRRSASPEEAAPLR